MTWPSNDTASLHSRSSDVDTECLYCGHTLYVRLIVPLEFPFYLLATYWIFFVSPTTPTPTILFLVMEVWSPLGYFTKDNIEGPTQDPAALGGGAVNDPVSIYFEVNPRYSKLKLTKTNTRRSSPTSTQA